MPDEPDDVVVWDETWAQPEEERVARWLRARTAHDPEARADDRSRPETYLPFGQADVRREAYRIDLTAAVDLAEGRIERSRREAVEDQAALETEIRSLEDRRQRLAAGLEAQQAEYDHAMEEHTAARSHLHDVVTDLEAHSAALAAELATAREEAEVARSERLQRMAELHGQAGALEEQRRQLAAMVETEYADAESAHEALVSEVTRLDGEVAALRQYRVELREAVVAGRAGAEEAKLAQEAEATRLGDEIRALEVEAAQWQVEAERQSSAGASPAADVDAFPAGGPEPGHQLAGAGLHVVDSGAPLDPSGRLAEAVAELGRHLAAVLEAERARSARLAREQDDARARFERERRLVEDPQSLDAERWRGGRQRRKRAP